MVRKRVFSLASLLVVMIGMVYIVIFNNHSPVSANVTPSHIYAVEDTRIIYMGTGGSKYMYEGGDLGYLDVGYQGSFGEPLEVQVLLKYNLPEIPEGYEVESANLYFPMIGGNIQGAASFSLKASSSLNHNWIEDTITNATLPAPIAGSTIARSVATNAPATKPVIGPFDFTSYVSDEIYKSNPRATFILSAFTAEQAAAANITSLDHYIQSTETHMGGTERPYLIITYSEIVNIEITGIADGDLYNSNVTPHFNVGTATLNGAPFTSGTIISNEGTYTLTVAQGNQIQTIQFTIDKTPPTATVLINNGSYFTNHQFIDVRITPDPDVTDIVSMRYSVNESTISTTQPYNSQFSIGVGLANGDKSVRVQLIDAAGNISPLYFWNFSLNTTIPSGNLMINSGAAYTMEQEVDILITPDASANEIVAMQFSTDNNNWSSAEGYNPSKRYALPPGDGDKTVYVRLVDRFGNIGILEESILLDMTPPTASVLINNGNSSTNNTNVAVHITPDAGVNDIAFIKYTINGLTPTTIAYTNSFNINVGNTNEEKVIAVTLIDRAEHISPEYSATVTLDTLPPTGTVTINGGAAYATEAEVTLGFTLGANVTDVVAVQFSNDNLTWSTEQAYSPSMSYTLPIGDGSKTIYVRFIDRAGNIGTAQASIVLDTVAPTGQLIINNNEPYSNSLELQLTLSTLDSSELAGVQFSNDGTAWSALEAYTNTKQWLVPGNGAVTIYVKFIDEAGNEYSTSSSIYVDTVKPIVSVAIEDGEVYTFSDTVDLTITASDPSREQETVTLAMELSHDGMSWLPLESYTQSKQWTVSNGFGAKRVYARVIDEAGNVSDIASAVIHYRSIPQLNNNTVNTTEDTQYSFVLPDFTYTNSDNIVLDSYTLITLPEHGVLLLEEEEVEAGAVVTADQLIDLVYVPLLNWSGVEQLEWHASADGVAAVGNAVVTIQVAAVNDKPVAEDFTLTKTNFSPAEGNLVATDIEGNSLTYHIVDSPAKGQVVLDEHTGAYTFTLDRNLNGSYTFTYRVFDGTDYSNLAIVTIKYTVSMPAPTNPYIPVTPNSGNAMLQFGENGLEVAFTGQIHIQGSSIDIYLTEEQLTRLGKANENQPVDLRFSESYSNAQLIIANQALHMLATNGNSLLLTTSGLQFMLSNHELKQMLTKNYDSYVIGIEKTSGELLTHAQEQARNGAYQLIGVPITFKLFAQSEGVNTRQLEELGTIVLSSTSSNPIPTAVLKFLSNGEPSPILATMMIDDQSYQIQVSQYGSGTYTIIHKQPAFTDISGWSVTAIDQLASMLILNGVNETTFEPTRAITRAEFASLISKALGLVKTSGSMMYTDIAVEAWYSDAIATVAELGFMNGYPDGSFRPAQQITREEAIVIVARVFGYLGSSNTLSASDVESILSGYSDQAQISSWSREHIALAVAEGIIMGDNGKLSVKDQITREQIAVIIVRLLERAEMI